MFFFVNLRVNSWNGGLCWCNIYILLSGVDNAAWMRRTGWSILAVDSTKRLVPVVSGTSPGQPRYRAGHVRSIASRSGR